MSEGIVHEMQDMFDIGVSLLGSKNKRGMSDVLLELLVACETFC